LNRKQCFLTKTEQLFEFDIGSFFYVPVLQLQACAAQEENSR
jgi:hypothetical protein